MMTSEYKINQVCVDKIHAFFFLRFGGSTKENTYVPPKKKRRENR